MRDGIAGIFVGGRASRMGGRAKGLFSAPGSDTPIAARLVELARNAGLEPVLVGANEAYAVLGVPMVPDDPPGVGPLGGLMALLRHAGNRPAVALACDLPHVTGPMLERLLAFPDAPIVAPRPEGRWQPFFARFDAPRVLPAAERVLASHRRALQAVLEAGGAVELPLSPEETACLRDWDSPEDVARDGGRIA